MSLSAPVYCRPAVRHILELFLESALRNIDADTGSVMLVQAGGQTMGVAAAYGLDEAVLRRATVRVEDSIAGSLLRETEPRWLRGPVDRSNWERPPDLVQRANAIVLPLRVEELALGTVNLTFLERQPPNEPDVLPRLSLQTRRLAQTLQAVEPYLVGEAALPVLAPRVEVEACLTVHDLEHALTMARTHLATASRADVCVFVLRDEDSLLNLIDRESLPPELVDALLGHALQRDMRRCMRDGAPRLCHVDGAYEGWATHVGLVPLRIERHSLGVACCLYAKVPDDIDRMLGSLAVLGQQAALSLANAQRAAQLERFAFTDYLTGLDNRQYWLRRLSEELPRAKRMQSPLAVLFFDVDDFKRYNDTFGHRMGDDVLKIIAALMRNALRRNDNAARFGGEEFVVLLPDTDVEQAMVVGERIRLDVEQYARTVGLPIDKGITVSGGIACYPRHACTAEALTDAADRAMYLSKSMGKNRMTVAARETTRSASG